jgi:hypothetical protein
MRMLPMRAWGQLSGPSKGDILLPVDQLITSNGFCTTLQNLGGGVGPLKIFELFIKSSKRDSI